MNYNTWINNINSNINQIMALKIIPLFKGTPNYAFVKLTDIKIIMALNNISDYRKILICFDIEFQTTNQKLESDYIFEYVSIDNNEFKAYSFIREFGLIIFVREESIWYYVGNTLLNFPELKNKKNTRYISSLYSTVTNKTLNKMNINDNLVQDLDIFKLYPNINTNISETILLQNNNYWNDPFVLNRTLTTDEAKHFLNTFLSVNGTYLVKGQMDIKVIKNHFRLLFNKHPKNIFNKVYDIEIYNNLSKTYFGSAKLKETFDNIIKLPIYNNSLYFDFLLNDLRPHNPVSDSIYTFIIAVIINLILINYLDNNN